VSRLAAHDVTLAYDGRVVSTELSIDVPDGRITVIVGPNASGKSTLLRALSRLLRPSEGTVVLDGQSIHQLPTKQVARLLGLLPQHPIAPDGILVGDLVARGRTPHQSLFQQWSMADQAAVRGALAATGTLDLADRPVDELSGGQRQRVWIAMALAQDTGLLLLDEPTTYLDITHQIEVLDLVATLNRSDGRTIVVVLHDLNLACRYAHHIVAMREGAIVATGSPRDVITVETMRDVFGLDAMVIDDPVSATPLVVPHSALFAPPGPAESSVPTMEYQT
jgi:iron complex transport system ATP-binding protein